MRYRTDLAYRYDGSFEGFLCCVFESYEKKEMPAAILSPDALQTVMFPLKTVPTNPAYAARVLRSIPLRISPEAEGFVRTAFLTCLDEKEIYLLRFLHMGFRLGAEVMNCLTDDAVSTLHKAVRHFTGEAHLLSGFLRFSDYSGILVSVIEPKNAVLPALAPHFVERFGNETFIIYDSTHKTALIHEKGRHEIIPLDSLELRPADDSEVYFRQLWKHFHTAIAVESRTNPRCQDSHLPKRYRRQMTEFLP